MRGRFSKKVIIFFVVVTYDISNYFKAIQIVELYYVLDNRI